MLLKNFMPSPAVREFVRFYRIVHFEFDTTTYAFKAFPPEPEHCLYFYPHDREKIAYCAGQKKIVAPPATLIGQQLFTSYREQETKQFLIVQIMFQPAGLYRLTGIGTAALTNEFLDAESVFSPAIQLINEQLYHAKDYGEMIRITDRFIETLSRKKVKAHHALDNCGFEMLNGDGLNRIGALAKQAFLSTKQFERKFLERNGVHPKQFEKVVRFNRAFMMNLKNPETPWKQIAYSCGYTDYQHLVKDYKEFTGTTPGQFRLLGERSAEHSVGIADEYYQSNRIGTLG